MNKLCKKNKIKITYAVPHRSIKHEETIDHDTEHHSLKIKHVPLDGETEGRKPNLIDLKY